MSDSSYSDDSYGDDFDDDVGIPPLPSSPPIHSTAPISTFRSVKLEGERVADISELDSLMDHLGITPSAGKSTGEDTTTKAASRSDGWASGGPSVKAANSPVKKPFLNPVSMSSRFQETTSNVKSISELSEILIGGEEGLDMPVAKTAMKMSEKLMGWSKKGPSKEVRDTEEEKGMKLANQMKEVVMMTSVVVDAERIEEEIDSESEEDAREVNMVASTGNTVARAKADVRSTKEGTTQPPSHTPRDSGGGDYVSWTDPRDQDKIGWQKAKPEPWKVVDTTAADDLILSLLLARNPIAGGERVGRISASVAKPVTDHVVVAERGGGEFEEDEVMRALPSRGQGGLEFDETMPATVPGGDVPGGKSGKSGRKENVRPNLRPNGRPKAAVAAQTLVKKKEAAVGGKKEVKGPARARSTSPLRTSPLRTSPRRSPPRRVALRDVDPSMAGRFNEHYYHFLQRLAAASSTFLSDCESLEEVMMERALVECMRDVIGDGQVRDLIREGVMRKLENNS